MDWQARKEVKKGNFGEKIVKEFLEKSGYVVYGCITERAHAFDFLAIKDKKVFVIAEVKSKARLNKYLATGIDIRHYNDYSNIYATQNIDIILFFVDEHPKEERIYCQKLSILSVKKVVDGIEYPNTRIAKGIVLFSISDMLNVCTLNDLQLLELRKYSTRSYDYE